MVFRVEMKGFSPKRQLRMFFLVDRYPRFAIFGFPCFQMIWLWHIAGQMLVYMQYTKYPQAGDREILPRAFTVRGTNRLYHLFLSTAMWDTLCIYRMNAMPLSSNIHMNHLGPAFPVLARFLPRPSRGRASNPTRQPRRYGGCDGSSACIISCN